VYLTASPNPGYVFSSWKENGNVVSTNKTYSFVASTSRNLIANFVCKKPDQPVTILGKTSICPSEKGVTYTVPADGFSTSYTWLLSNGALGSSNSNSITIDYGDSFDAGTLSVRGENFCGVSSYKIVDIGVVDPPQKVGEISGKKEVCQGEASVLYTIPSMPNAISYNWFLPAGATGSSNTNSILVNFGNSAVSGEVSVKGVNDCSESTYSVYEVKVMPVEELGVISGETNVCAGSTVTYSVVANRNVLNYVWTLPGGTITTTSTNSLNYYISGHSSEGVIKVKGKFACGDGPESSLVITCSDLPEIGQISGVIAVCQGTTEIYSVQNDSEIEEYNWVLPEGAIGSSTSNTITVSFPEVKSGNIRVKGKNSCGFGRENSLFVTVNPIPPIPEISYFNNDLLSSALAGNQWYWNNEKINGAEFQKYDPTGEGDYFVIVTINNCSSNQSNIYQYTISEVGVEGLKSTVQIFPNPISDMLYIEFTSPVKGNTNIEIYNCLGKVIYSNIISEQDHLFPVHFSEFPSGVYLIRMQLDKEIVLQKIIKK